jgi:iron-sulfur cluster insertion protein
MHQLTVNETAADKIKSLLKDEDTPNLMLRIFVSGGGCSGFQYGFTFDENQNEDDFVIEQHDVKLLVDAMSMQYLAGSEIAYETTLAASQFTIKNPNATSKCGCGSSFSA